MMMIKYGTANEKKPMGHQLSGLTTGDRQAIKNNTQTTKLRPMKKRLKNFLKVIAMRKNTK